LFQFSFKGSQNQPVSTDAQCPGTLVNSLQKLDRDVNTGAHEYVRTYSQQGLLARETFGRIGRRLPANDRVRQRQPSILYSQ
jgi:hypothetical protein